MNYKIENNAKRLFKNANDSLPTWGHLSLEVLEILTSLYFFRQPMPESDDFIENMRTIHVSRLLHDDIVLRLCKFNDLDTRTWSIDQANKNIRKRQGGEAALERLPVSWNRYRQLIQPIQDHRNAYIAHRTKRDRTHLKPLEFNDAIKILVEIVDIFAGQPCLYQLGNIDLRKELLKD